MFRKMTAVLPATTEGLGQALDFIENELKKHRFQSKEIYNAMLLSEESMVRLIENTEPDAKLHLSVRYRRGLAYIGVSLPGAILQSGSEPVNLETEDGDMSRSSEAMIRQMLLQANQNRLKYSRKGKYNFIRITAGSPEHVFLLRMLISLALAVVLGVILNLTLPASVKTLLDENLLTPVQTIFINTLKLAVGPTVFFSILASVARFTAFSDPGKVSMKVIIGYLITSLAAVLTGGCVFRLLQPGQTGQLISYVGQAVMPTAGNRESVRDAIVNIVPPNIIDPFLNLDTLQLIFLALLFGFALGRIGDYSSTIFRAAEAMETLCGKATEILNSITPTAVFFSTIALIFGIGLRSLLYVAELLGVLAAAMAVLLLFYGAILLLSGLNPLMFLRKFRLCIREIFFGGSGVAALPKTVRCCRKALGVSSKVCSFSLPFGAIANMDGNCVYLTVTGLFLARLCGVEMISQDILPMILIVLILSVGAPISSGTVLMCMMMLLNQMNVSPTALTLILGINVVVERILAVTNVLGDVTITLAVAKSEKLLDTDVYRSPNCR